MNKKIVRTFDYEGYQVTFEKKNGQVMINATEMCRKYGKRPNDWLNLQSAKDYISALTDTRKNGIADFQAVMTVKGGYGEQGTWLDANAAVELARWLEPKFAVWCNDRVFDFNSNNEPMQKIVSQQQVSASMTAIKWAKKLLRLNDTSVAGMINRVTNEYQLPVSVDYVESKGTVHSLSELLKAHNIDMSTNAFNKLLEAKGIIKKIFRKSRNGEKSFWSLIDTKYGENFVNPKNPSETQPKYYDDMFNELIQIAL